MKMAWTVTLVLGAVFGAAELMARFKDEPFQIIRTDATAWIYILLNLTMAGATFYFLTKTTLFGRSESDLLKAALTAGLGSNLLMRSKFLKLTISGKEAAIGPEVIINILLENLEKRIDRCRALTRKNLVEEHMKDIDFHKVKNYVITTILASSQINSEETTKNLMNEADKIENSKTSDREKSYALGYLVIDCMGERFLKELFNVHNRQGFKRSEDKELIPS